jgi:hypothetical protein
MCETNVNFGKGKAELKYGGLGVAQVEEYVSRKCEVLNSIPNTAKNKFSDRLGLHACNPSYLGGKC